MTVTKRARILLADDHSLVAAGISKLLEAEFDLIGTVGDGRALVASARSSPRDVILLDISMPLLNGLEAARQIRTSLPNVKLIFVTVHSDNAYVMEAFRAGGSGYVLKRSAASELPAAIHEVLNGNLYVTPLVGQTAADTLRNANKWRTQILSGRQRDVLQLVA